MKVLMVGAGSVGGFFGARLVQGGVECSFLLRSRTLEAVKKHGLTVRGVDQSFIVHPQASSDAKQLPAPDVIILSVKRYDLYEALQQLRPVLTPQTLILTLQNGVDTEDRIEELLPGVRIVGGVAYIYAKIAEPGVIDHYKKGTVAIGTWNGAEGSADLSVLTALFEKAEIKCQVVDDIRRTKWEKMCWNVVFNPLTVLIDDRVSKALSHTELRGLIERIVDETVAVARAEGVELGADMSRKIIQWSQEIRDIHTSMYDDWKAGRSTEIESLNGYVVRRGQVMGIPTPVNETLYALIKAITEPAPVDPVSFRIDGRVIQPLVLDREALGKLPAESQVADVSALYSGMSGQGVRVRALLEIATPTMGADHVTFHSDDGQFAVSLRVKDAAETGVLVYQRDGQALPKEAGGPFRLITPGLGDPCANVKGVSRIEFTIGPGVTKSSPDKS